MLYVPAGIAHGFQCLADNVEVFYQMSESYYPELARGIHSGDAQVGIKWPVPDAIISERDAALPLIAELQSS
jgi:dTDP-4-dehydrorhamnose 3,5-epimerase